MWVPVLSVEVANVAIPEAFSVPVPNAVPESLKVTLPVGIPPLLDTVAVKVTVAPVLDGLADELNAVVVEKISGLTTCESAVD